MVGCHGEGAFQRDACAAYRAFVKQSADQSDPVGNAAGRDEFGQRMLWVGRPVGARLPDFDVAGTNRERRMAGVVADGEHFIAKGWNQEQVHIREYASHLLANFAAKAVSLNKIHCGKKTSLAE